MGSSDYQYTVPDSVAVELSFVAFLYHFQTWVHDLSCHFSNFLWRTVNSKPPTIPFGMVACTFSDNLSRNSCILLAFCMFRKRWYAFSFGRVKTIRIRSGVSVWSMQYMSLSGFVWTWPEFLFLFNWVSLLTSWHVGNTCSECRELRTTR